MSKIYVGVDVSKGYADVCVTNETGVQLAGGGRFDDTAAGHGAVRDLLNRYTGTQAPERQLMIAIEATGGLERNWLRLFAKLTQGGAGCLYQLNPLAVRRFRERELHKNVTDPASARDLAAYLRNGLRRGEHPYQARAAGTVAYYRCLRSAIERTAQLQNELKSLLSSTHPELVQYCRQGFPQWVLRVLVRYPTTQKLARARPGVLARIPHLGADRAESLITAAKQSVASLIDPDAGDAVQFLASEILRLEAQVSQRKRDLSARLAKEEEATLKVLTSFAGIGDWSATVLLLEVGSFDRFPTSNAIVAYAGLDPHYEQSGDIERCAGITHRGRAEIRAILFTCVMAGLRHNPVIKEYYARLRSVGKPHMVAVVACMTKLLRLAYTCVLKQEGFDPELPRRERERYDAEAARRTQQQAITRSEAQGQPTRSEALQASLAAPVSRREAARRRAATAPQRGQAPSVGGHSATLSPKHVRATSRRQDPIGITSTA